MARTKAISLIQSGSTKVDLAELSGLVISNIQKDTLSQGLKSQAYTGNPASGSVEFKRFKNSASQPYGCLLYTSASGAIAEEGVTIAADWSVYSPGTILYIEGIGERTVQDRGGAISGQKIDVFFNSHEDALRFGRQEVRIKVISDTEKMCIRDRIYTSPSFQPTPRMASAWL